MTETTSTRPGRDESNETAILLTDGGEDQEEDAETSAESQDESTGGGTSESADGEGSETGGEQDGERDDEYASEEEEANVLYLDLEGLFVDLLGLEIELDEVELDVNAVSGDNNLLGNLLNAVAGLLDGDLGAIPSIDLSGKLEEGMGSVTDALGDWVGKVFDELEAPLQELMTQLIKGVIEQLVDGAGSNGQQAAAAEA